MFSLFDRLSVSRIGGLLLTASLLCGHGLTVAAPHFADILPADSDALILVEDVPTLLEQTASHPVFTIWNNVDVQLELTRLHDWLKAAENEAFLEFLHYLTDQSIAALFKGQLAIEVSETQQWLDLESGGGRFALLAVIDPQARDRVAALANQLLEQVAETIQSSSEVDARVRYRIVEEDYRGQTLAIQQRIIDREVNPGPGWAIVDDTLIIAQPVRHLEALVSAHQRGEATTPWSETDDYRAVHRNRDAAASMLVNGVAAKELLAAATARAEPGEDELNLDYFFLLATLELIKPFIDDTFARLFMQIQVDRHLSALEFSADYHQSQGPMELFAFHPGPVEFPDWLPGESTFVSVSNFNFAELIEAIIRIGDRDPENPIAFWYDRNTLQTLSDEAGIDIHRTLLDSVGDHTVEFELLASDTETSSNSAETIQTQGIAIRDRRGIELAAKALLDQTGIGQLFESNRYLDTDVISSKSGMPAYAITDDYLLIASSKEAIHRTLSAMQRSNQSTPAWFKRHSETLWVDPDDTASAVALYEPSRAVYDLIKTISQWQNLLPRAQSDSEGSCGAPSFLEPSTFAALPDTHINELVSTIHKNEKRLRVSYRMSHAR